MLNALLCTTKPLEVYGKLCTAGALRLCSAGRTAAAAGNPNATFAHGAIGAAILLPINSAP